jgi:hypothetical protein
MDFVDGQYIRFQLMTSSHPTVVLGGPYSDDAIAREFYGEVCAGIEHDPSDNSVVYLDPTLLQPRYQKLFQFHTFADGYDPWGGKLLMLGGVSVDALGTQADVLRQLYNSGAEQILAKGRRLIQDGSSAEEVARWVVRERNALKVTIRSQGPLLFQKIAEYRNMRKYRNPVGPNYEQLAAKGLSDLEIIEGTARTSEGFNAVGGRLRFVGRSVEAVGFVLQAMENSPASYEPLPKSDEEQMAAELARLRYGIPADANIDRHGHLKPYYYLQVDMFDPHVGDEMDQETVEILWWLGVDVTYHYRNVTWTVPGREW